ncbi:hypothetical protein VPHD148_0151 [Vibrio phage D148]
MIDWIKRNNTLLFLTATAATAGYAVAVGDTLWAFILAGCVVWDVCKLQK